MRKIIPTLGATTIFLTLIAGCQNSPTSKDISISIVNDVVLPSYERLVDTSAKLNSSLSTLSENPTANNLQKARNIWRAARETWEVTETWAYGPAETMDFDPDLDDWPVSKNELSTALNEKSKFTSNTFNRLDTTSRGFHGIEYVLFGESGVEASQLTSQELSYLKIAGNDLESKAKGLLAAWDSDEGFGVQEVQADPNAAIQDILSGMQGCLEEVADGKLGTPFDASDKGELESVFSGNTGVDVVNNIRGVKRAWEKSKVSHFVRTKDSDLAKTLSNQIDIALKLAKRLPSRLNNKISDPSTQDQIQELREALTEAANTTYFIAKKL